MRPHGSPAPLWATDGRTLYGYGERSGDERGADWTVYALDLPTGAVRDLGQGLDRAVLGVVGRPDTGVVADFGRPGTVVAVTRHRRTHRTAL